MPGLRSSCTLLLYRPFEHSLIRMAWPAPSISARPAPGWETMGCGDAYFAAPATPEVSGTFFFCAHDVFASRLRAGTCCFPSYEVRGCVCFPRFPRESLCWTLSHSLLWTLSRLSCGSTELFVGHTAQERDYFSEENFAFPGCFADEQCRSPLSTRISCPHGTASWGRLSGTALPH